MTLVLQKSMLKCWPLPGKSNFILFTVHITFVPCFDLVFMSINITIFVHILHVLWYY